MNNKHNYNTKAMSDEEIKQSFAKCFISREGQIVLSFLRRITLERYLGPNATGEELRHLEGQRHLVKHIEALSSYQN